MTQITTQHFEPGVRWTFTHRDGTSVEYVYDRTMQNRSAGLDAVHALLNPITGKEAMVTEKWMREGCVSGGPHWTLGEAA